MWNNISSRVSRYSFSQNFCSRAVYRGALFENNCGSKTQDNSVYLNKSQDCRVAISTKCTRGENAGQNNRVERK